MPRSDWFNKRTAPYVLGGGAFALLATFLALNPFRIVNDGEACIRRVLGKVTDEVVYAGFRMRIPIVENFECNNIKTVEIDELSNTVLSAVTRDNQTIQIEVSAAYAMDATGLPKVVIEQGDRNNLENAIIIPRIISAIKNNTAQYPIGQLLQNRARIETEINSELAPLRDEWGAYMTNFALVNIDFSEEYDDAIEAKQIQQQRAEQAEFVEQENEALGRAEVALARGQAEAIELRANALNAAGGELAIAELLAEGWIEKGAPVPHVMVNLGEGGVIEQILGSFLEAE